MATVLLHGTSTFVMRTFAERSVDGEKERFSVKLVDYVIKVLSVALKDAQ